MLRKLFQELYFTGFLEIGSNSMQYFSQFFKAKTRGESLLVPLCERQKKGKTDEARGVLCKVGERFFCYMFDEFGVFLEEPVKEIVSK